MYQSEIEKQKLQQNLNDVQKMIVPTSSQTIAKPNVVRRFFFICTAGREFNNSVSFNAFDIKTDDGNYPTYKKCLEVSETKYPNQRAVTLLSISEVPASDWKHFLSAQ